MAEDPKIHPVWGGNVVHGVEEFANLPWERLDPERIGRDWSFGKGGYGFSDDTWTVSYPDDERNIVWHVWALPSAIVAIIKSWSEIAVKNKLEQIHKALNI